MPNTFIVFRVAYHSDVLGESIEEQVPEGIHGFHDSNNLPFRDSKRKLNICRDISRLFENNSIELDSETLWSLVSRESGIDFGYLILMLVDLLERHLIYYIVYNVNEEKGLECNGFLHNTL